MRRFFWVLIPGLTLALVLAAGWNFSERKLAQFIVHRTKIFVSEEIQWKLEIDKLELHLAPPGIKIAGIRLTPLTPTPWIQTIVLSEITANLDFLNLLAGQIKFANIRVKDLDTDVIVDQIPPSKKPLTQLPIEEIFDFLDLFPIKLALAENWNIRLKMHPNSSPIFIKGDFLLETSPQTIHYGLKMNAHRQGKTPEALLKLNLNSKGSLDQKNLRIQDFSLETPKSQWGLDGEFLDFSNMIKKPKFKGFTDLTLNAEEVVQWTEGLLALQHSGSSIKAKGEVRAKGRVNLSSWQEPHLELQTELRDISLEDFKIGYVKTNLTLSKQILKTTQIEVSHPAGLVHLKSLQWNTSTDQLSSEVDLQKLNLQTLFIELHLQGIPVELGVAAQLQCQGHLLSNFKIDCLGKVEGRDLDVRSIYHGPNPPIVQLSNFYGEGKVSINAEEVSYKTSVILNNSMGHSEGVINYNKGFVIDFDADTLNFKDVNKIAGLELEGLAKLQGRTQGDSQSAVLDIAIQADDFWFENFGLGQLNGKIIYQKGHLLIDVPQAQWPHSQYIAKIDVDLLDSQLDGLVESPDLTLSDAIVALKRRAPLPFTANGSGHVRAQFNGPFSLGKLNYTLEGLVKKGDLQGETFDELRWNLVSKEGQVRIENNFLRKGHSLISVNGKAIPTGHIALEVEGNNFKLENSTFLSQFVKTLGGDLNFQMSISNHILRPHIFLEGKIERTTLGDSELPDSKFIVETDSLGQTITLDLLGHQATVEMDLPYQEDDPARLLIDIQKFDFTNILGLLTGSPLRNDYNSLVSMKVDLQSQNNSLFEATGRASIDEFYLSRGENYLSNPKPISVFFDHGYATLKDFNLKGYNSEVHAFGERFTPSRLNIGVGGNIDLRLLQMFTPFLDDVSGPIKGQLQINGSLNKPEIYGDVDFNEVAVRIKGFPPMFDHVNAHLEFSQKKIIVESLRGHLAGGTIAGEGSINLNGLRDVKVDVKAQLRNLQMEVPEHIQSSGSGDIVISGNWFPYTLSGSYRVQQAFIDKDFTSETSDNNVRHSIYLPKNLSENGFDPIVLDLQIFLDKGVEVKNPQMAGFLSGQLQIKGPPQSPILAGTIKTLPQAQLFFRDKVFDVQSGVVRFTDPNEINPDLYFTARSLVDKYEISMLLQGKAKSPQLALSSQPPLEEQDIISLLALGMTTQKLDSQVESSQQAAQTGYQLGTAIISANPLNKEIKQSLGVDVKFSSGFDETKNVALPRVTISKDLIPRKLTASATSSFSENQNYDVRFQYLLNDRISTVVTYERSEGQEGNVNTGTNQSNISIFGLDLEYKMEFK